MHADEVVAGQHRGVLPISVYDNYPGGIGFSAPLYQVHGELLDATRRLIAECPCENGCPGCVGPIGNTGPLAKAAALRILQLLLADAKDTEVTADIKQIGGADDRAADREVIPF